MKFYRNLIQTLLLSIFLLATSFAQNLSLERILSSHFPTTLVAASNANVVAWVYNHEGKRNIWVAKGPNYNGKAITTYQQDDGQDISNLLFTPDGSQIIFVRGGAPNRQGEIPNPTSQPDGAKREIWIIDADGKNLRKLTSGSSPSLLPDRKTVSYLNRGRIWTIGLEENSKAEQLFEMRGGASNPMWSPDGNQLAFVSNRGDHSFVGVYDKKEHTINYLNPTVDRDNNPVWSPDGKKIAFMRTPNQSQILPFAPRRSGLPWSIMVADVASGKVSEVWKAKERVGSVYRFISATKQLFWGANNRLIFPWEGDGWTHLYSISAAGGESICLTPGEFEVQFVSISNDGTEVFFSSNQNDIDRQHIWKVGVNGGKPEALTSGKGIEWAPVQASSGTILCLASGPTTPAYAARIGKNSQLQPLAKLPNFPSDQLVEPKQVIFPGADGMPIHGQLFLPQNMKAGEKYPALLFFHGGSRRQMLLGFHHRGYYHNAYAMNQYMANQGYIVLSVNYRSGIGYGMEFREALNYGAQGASEFNDVLGAGLYLRSRADVAPDKIGLWGGSYGGYLTALGLARASDLFAAGVDIHGVHDWNVVIRNFVPNYQPEKRAAFAKLAFESSPMAHLDGWRSPVLLIHGDDDRNVPFSETVDVAESLRRHNVYFEQLIFPDEVHGFLLHKNWVTAFKATADFFDRMLKKEGNVVAKD